MRFETEESGTVLIVTPPEMDLDASNADEFKTEIAGILDARSEVLVDLAKVGFMDSAGLGAMLSAFKKVRGEGGMFRICGPNAEVKALFELVRMHRLFEIHETRESALRSFG